MTDADLAAHLADIAGKLLIGVRESGVFSPKALGKAGDATANQFLVHALIEQRPEDGLLSEEAKDTDDRLGKSRVWIVDPVDGTREYGEARTDWAVHVGLAIDRRCRRTAGLGRCSAHRSAGHRSARTASAAYGCQPHPPGA
jgi:3'(2'), 5'-bisphosphate nucleotidase